MKNKTHLKIDSEHLILRNNPELAKLFARDDLQELLRRILQDIDDPYGLKRFLKLGHKKFYEGIIDQLKNSYEIIKSKKEDNITILVLEVKRSFDGKVFKVGDVVTVTDKVHDFDEDGDPTSIRKVEWSRPIGRMYCKVNEDDLKIRLDDQDKSITWRKLSQLK